MLFYYCGGKVWLLWIWQAWFYFECLAVTRAWDGCNNIPFLDEPNTTFSPLFFNYRRCHPLFRWAVILTSGEFKSWNWCNKNAPEFPVMCYDILVKLQKHDVLELRGHHWRFHWRFNLLLLECAEFDQTALPCCDWKCPPTGIFICNIHVCFPFLQLTPEHPPECAYVILVTIFLWVRVSVTMMQNLSYNDVDSFNLFFILISINQIT